MNSESFTTCKYISHIPVKSKLLKENWESEDDQEYRPYGIVGINDGLIKYSLLAVEDNLDHKFESISSYNFGTEGILTELWPGGHDMTSLNAVTLYMVPNTTLVRRIAPLPPCE